MKVMVTGATGFVGRHVVKKLVEKGYSISAVARDIKKAKKMHWFEHVRFIQCDLHQNYEILFNNNCTPDVVIHLAWQGLPNYNDFFHINENLHFNLTFLEFAAKSGVQRLIVAGTCLEYGMQYGPLTEEMETFPITPYGFAKDTLRKALELMQKQISFSLQWMRLFFMFGEGQNRKSLLSQIDYAIDNEKPVFNMSMGDQLRDYLPIEEVAENFALAVKNPQVKGVINCCSGRPISVYDFVKKRCQYRNSNIKLNRGYYEYPDYEPLAFWGVPSKLDRLKSEKIQVNDNETK